MIKTLSRDVVTEMKSHLNFTSVYQIMEIYVNDAIKNFNASAIEIVFEVDNLRLEMIDNGDGIPTTQIAEFVQNSCMFPDKYCCSIKT
jgi:glucose-6-phosphate-specific signal transduction histidine kinase